MEEKIPNLKLTAHNKVMEQTIDIPLLINEKKTNVTVRKLSTGIRNKIRSESATTKILGGQPSITVNDVEIQEKILSACIVSAPFDSTLTGIKNLPAEVSDYIFEEYNEFAEPSSKKKD